LTPRVLRLAILRLAGVKIARVHIRPGVIFTTRQVRIGTGSFINRNCYFDSKAWVTIGERVQVGHGAVFCTSTHEIGDAYCRAGATLALPIEVRDGTWIGARSLLLPGVVVGEGCIVASGAVVTRDCAPNGLYAGVPARRVRELD